MNHPLRTLALLVATALPLTSAQAAVGIFGNFVEINDTWYQTANPGANQITGYNGLDLGTVSSLVITDASVLTFKNSGGDVTGAQVWWFVNGGGAGSGIQNIGFGSENPAVDPAGNSYPTSGDQNWQGSTPSIDLITGLTPGEYTLSLFYRITSNEGEFFDANGGANYSASFTVVPEPSTLLLALTGLLALATVRRRRR
jgi:hypothetical protein